MENFDLKEATKLWKEGVQNDLYDGCKNYIKRFWFPTTKGEHFLLKDNQFVCLSQEEAQRTYFNRLPKEIKIWYFTKNLDLYDVIAKIGEPLVSGNKINFSGQFKHPKKDYKLYPAKTKAKVEKMLSFIRKVICSGKDNYYNFIVKWLANTAKGCKNDVCLYLKGPKRIGKSTLPDFIAEYVLGYALSAKANTGPLLERFNRILCGKLFVYFEELPVFTESQWKSVTSKLKDMITGKRMTYEEKGEKQFEAENINNFIVISNHNSIREADDDRYFETDLSLEHQQDYVYFGDLKENCFNDECGEAFYNYLLSIDTTGFVAQREAPATQNKLDAIVERMDLVHKFVKDNYVLHPKDLKCRLSDAYEEYTEYCATQGKKPNGKIQFTKKLAEVGILHKKSNGYDRFNVSKNELKDIANKRKWIHKLDEIEELEDDVEQPDDDEIQELKKTVDVLTQQNKMLMERLKQYETQPIKRQKSKSKSLRKYDELDEVVEIDTVENNNSVDDDEIIVVKKKTGKAKSDSKIQELSHDMLSAFD